ncbi:HPr family phosphocarrier protein [Chitinispirillales bacterium ANBcel5]|uniref:HPr family phosphocarrier protein n=1 Tax=Cellulosispirillum alkaliphilum TaxID=3039283 RepID=UPI002A554304|nr:HPr family phosphocarrier protein [Chitinispirillales bacterium ANBcel5]
MTERTVKVVNSLGIHARPASLIVQTAMKHKSSIQLIKDEVPADAKSIMSVMMLAASVNTSVVIRAEGEDEKEAVDSIAALFEKKFNEE